MTTRKVHSVVSGREIPVTVDLHVKPLTFCGVQVKNGHGRIMMDDEWIYCFCPGYGNISVNVNRAAFCQQVYLSQVRISDYIENQKMTRRLRNFISSVSDKMVFKYNGTTYIFCIEKTKGEYDLKAIKPYWSTISTGGIWDSYDITKKMWPGSDQWNYKGVDLRTTFGFCDEN